MADQREAHHAAIPNSQIADSPYFHPHSWWSDRSGASWVYSIWIGCCRLGHELTLCFQRVVLRRRRSHPGADSNASKVKDRRRAKYMLVVTGE